MLLQLLGKSQTIVQVLAYRQTRLLSQLHQIDELI